MKPRRPAASQPRAIVPELRRLQRWFSYVVQHPSTADVAIAEREAQTFYAADAVAHGRLVKPNDRMSPTDRLQVYNGGYLARLLEVMAVDHGGLKHLLGAETFDRLCARYVAAHPSHHQNLNQFGKELPAFLAAQRVVPHKAFAVELAQMEVAMVRAFDAPAVSPLPPGKLQEVPPERWAKARLSVHPSLVLCAFRHPVNRWYQAWRDGQEVAVPRREASWVGVYRHDYRVWRMDLTKPAFAVLSALAAGEPLAQALERAQGSPRVGEWFQGWAADGLFTAIRFGR